MSKDARATLSAGSTSCPFHRGDRVYLAKGSYQGSIGIFLNLGDAPKWADICEPNEVVRAHPVEWMALSGPEGAENVRIPTAGPRPA
jgi:hypothetical protein